MARGRGGSGRSRRGGKRIVANTKAPANSYAVVKHQGNKTIRKYPVNTIARARNALARVSAFGSPSEKAAVKRKVKARYPALARRSSVIATPKPKSRRGTRTKRSRRR